MKILQIIHGYPPAYNAGSEIYTQTLSRGLSIRHEVHVFTREENPYSEDYRLRHAVDAGCEGIGLHVVNLPRSRDRYRHIEVDRLFADLLRRVQPDVVHIGHLNHLSTSLVAVTAAAGVPVVFTLHDFWLACPRGQFIQTRSSEGGELWPLCDGQSDEKCACSCYAGYFSGDPAGEACDTDYWRGWVRHRMEHIREMVEMVDLFICPSRRLGARIRDELGIPSSKLYFLDYGFDRECLADRHRVAGEPFTFGYIGTHIPAKGVPLLLEAFGRRRDDTRLRVWGRFNGKHTAGLKALVDAMPSYQRDRVEWCGEYDNMRIVEEVFSRVDAIVVPSIWLENSPLVIHEAQQARVPVITADAGGMSELVEHGVNGLLFKHRDIEDLARQMNELAADPARASRLGQRGYLYSPDGDVVDIEQHAYQIEAIYNRVIEGRGALRISQRQGPRRITFDTNPDTCNLSCIMCERHSPHVVRSQTVPREKRVMPIDLVEQVIRQAVPLGLEEIIPSTMGEPLLYEDFDRILNACRESGVRLNLTTNGTFPGRGARAWAEAIVPLASDVKISVNGATRATQESIMRGSRWQQTLDNTRQFIEVRDRHADGGGDRCRVTFQVTFMQSNLHELPALVRLAADLGVDRLKGHHLWVHYPEMTCESLLRDARARHAWNAAVIAVRQAADRCRKPDGSAVILQNFMLLDENGTKASSPDGRCPFLGHELWIDTEGRIAPCCAPHELRRTLGDFGRIQDKSLQGLWEGPDYRALLNTYHNRSLCQSCHMRNGKVDEK